MSNITAATLTVSGIVAANKVYDANTVADPNGHIWLMDSNAAACPSRFYRTYSP